MPHITGIILIPQINEVQTELYSDAFYFSIYEKSNLASKNRFILDEILETHKYTVSNKISFRHLKEKFIKYTSVWLFSKYMSLLYQFVLFAFNLWARNY